MRNAARAVDERREAEHVKGVTAMASPWVDEEMRDVDLKDQRLNDRLREVLSQLGSHPTASIPAACGGHAEMTAAYRLFDNDKVDFDSVLDPHVTATHRRIAAEPVVILVQDTTEIDLTRPEQQVVGAGPLDGGTRRGFFLHPLHAFTPCGTPLGTVSAKAWVREDAPLLPAAQRAARRKQTPIEEKESQRWIDMMRQAREEARRSPNTRFVAMADSEADIYELLVAAQAEPHEIDWIVRACQDRAVKDGQEQATTHGVREQVLSQEVLFTHTIQVRGRRAKVQCEDRGRRQPRQSRTAEVEVRVARVTLRAPRRPDRVLPEVAVNVVLVREINPPTDEPAVEWMLLTSLPIDTVDQVRQVIQYYCVRWMIEVLFRTLKSGCRVEERRFEHVDRMLACLATYLIVAWRTLYVCQLGRALPDISCEAIFEPAEWKSLYRVVHRQPHPPHPPSLSEVVRMVAELGGYVSRKRDDMPGPQTVWLGLQRLHDISLCWKLFGPEVTTEVALV
jgi:hypothetical protein